MDWQLYVYSFLAGVLGANGVPHFVKGVSGEKHMTPFARSSSAMVNVVWGWVNLVVAALLLYWGHVHAHLLRAFALFAVGALLLGVLMAYAAVRNNETVKMPVKNGV